MMDEYGIDNVRGSSYCTIELSENDRKKAQQQIYSITDRCYKCGEKGHFAKDCGSNSVNKIELNDTSKILCHNVADIDNDFFNKYNDAKNILEIMNIFQQRNKLKTVRQYEKEVIIGFLYSEIAKMINEMSDKKIIPFGIRNAFISLFEREKLYRFNKWNGLWLFELADIFENTNKLLNMIKWYDKWVNIVFDIWEIDMNDITLYKNLLLCNTSMGQ